MPSIHDAENNLVANRLCVSIVLLLLAGPMGPTAGLAQQAVPTAKTEDPHYAQIEKQLQGLTQQLSQTQEQLQKERDQIRALQDELRTLRNGAPVTANQANPKQAVPGSPAPGQANSNDAYDRLQHAVEQLQEESQVQQSEISQHDQTKVETESKYPVKVNGMVLFNTFLNDGGVDSIDLPVISIPVANGQPSGSVGATLRQTIFGLSARGPEFAGARSSADVQIDFFGGIANAGQSSAGVVRMRTADVNLDWTNTEISAGFQGPLISPVSPTSYATVGEPALAWSGNLWVWAPQIGINREIPLTRDSHAHLQVGLYDPAAPGPASNYNERQASPSESSKRPALESRISYMRGEDDWGEDEWGRERWLEIGIGGYFSPQRYANGQSLDAWAGTLDWQLPFSKYLALSGEFYRGNAIGDLGGGVFKDIVGIYNKAEDETYIEGLNDVGGWSQLKLTPIRNLEFNAAFGLDNGFAGQLEEANPPTSNPQPATNYYTTLARNRTIFGNVIYHPRAYLLFSLEYRTISSWQVYGRSNTANIISLAGGYSF